MVRSQCRGIPFRRQVLFQFFSLLLSLSVSHTLTLHLNGTCYSSIPHSFRIYIRMLICPLFIYRARPWKRWREKKIKNTINFCRARWWCACAFGRVLDITCWLVCSTVARCRLSVVRLRMHHNKNDELLKPIISFRLLCISFSMLSLLRVLWFSLCLFLAPRSISVSFLFLHINSSIPVIPFDKQLRSYRIWIDWIRFS